MAEWPVRTEDFEPRPYEREPILAGTELVLMRSRGQGGELVGYHFCLASSTFSMIRSDSNAQLLLRRVQIGTMN